LEACGLVEYRGEAGGGRVNPKNAAEPLALLEDFSRDCKLRG
jgi:hypothetical protein